MTNPAPDMLTYAQELESTGLSRDQAAAIARGSAGMLEQRFNAVATQQSVDALSEQMRDRFTEVNRRFSDLDRRVARLEDLPAQIRVNTWMLAVLTIAVVVPQLQRWLTP